MGDKETIWGVHDDDLEGLLTSLGLLGKLRAGQLRCAFCRNSLSEDDLYSIFPHGGVVKVSCERADCVTALMQFSEGVANER